MHPVRDKLVRQGLGLCLDYANRMDLASMIPQGRLASTAYCLANPGLEYLGFAPAGGTFTIDLSAAAGPVSVTWLNIRTGKHKDGAAVIGGTSKSVKAPFSGPAVVHIKHVE